MQIFVGVVGKKRYRRSALELKLISLKIPRYIDDFAARLAETFFLSKSEVYRLAILVAFTVLYEEVEPLLRERAEWKNKVPIKRIEVE